MSHKDPYKIWLFEIIMQQTRISQGTPYYERFINKYPSVQDLASAHIDEVLKLWEGLGYYSRARNLHHAANQVVQEFGGFFPKESRDLLKLKGIGKYTSAAIASFAHNEKIGVVDGNVYRVIARTFGKDEPIDQGSGKKVFENLVQELVDEKRPALFNQAIMDFGALQCVPKKPICEKCTMTDKCFAFAKKEQHLYPVKSKKLVKKKRYFNYLVISVNEKTLIRQRVKSDVWKLLYEFPYLEDAAPKKLRKAEVKSWLLEHLNYTNQFEWQSIPKTSKQQLTHQTIFGSFHKITLAEPPNVKMPQKLIKTTSLKKYAFPKLIDCYLNDNSISLFE